MEILSKITVSTIGSQPKPQTVKEPERLAVIMGTIRGYSVGTGTYGDFLKFEGSFEAQNLKDEKTFKSGRLILPNIIAPILQGGVDAAQAGSEGKEPVELEFAIAVGVKPDSKGNTGYSYTVEPLVEPKDSEAMRLIRDRANKALAALPAPKESKKK